MKSSATTISELFARAAESASKSNPKPALTKAGIALTVEARHKLQQLARWIELELEGNQDPRVRLAYYGGVVTHTHENTTYVTPLGALVQMFEPFKLVDAKMISHGVYTANSYMLQSRVASVLGISRDEVHQLVRYIYKMDTNNQRVIEQLRTLK